MGGIYQPAGGGGSIPGEYAPGELVYVNNSGVFAGAGDSVNGSGLIYNQSPDEPTLSAKAIIDGVQDNRAIVSASNTGARFQLIASGVVGHTLNIELLDSVLGGAFDYSSPTAGADFSFNQQAGGSFYFTGTTGGGAGSRVEISSILQNARVILTSGTTGVDSSIALEASGSSSGPVIRNTSTSHPNAPMNFFNDGTGIFQFAALTSNLTQTRVVNNNDGGGQDYRVQTRSSNGGGFNNYSRTTAEVTFGANTTGMQTTVYDGAVVTQTYCQTLAVNTVDFNSSGGDFVWQGSAANKGFHQYLTQMSANGAVANVLGALGPAGSNVAVQEWLQIKNAAGVIRYIPCW